VVEDEGVDRFSRLFADVEAQLAADDRAQLEGDLADQTRSARGEVLFRDRLRASQGRPVALRLAGVGVLQGVVRHVGDDWLVLVNGDSAAPSLVLLDAVLAGQRVSPRSLPAGRSAVAARLSLRSVLRSVARDRSPLRVWIVDGHRLTGTIDSVGHDHVDLACHSSDEARRPGAVREHQTLLFSALALLTPAQGTSSLGW
jgi:hypothetical protein